MADIIKDQSQKVGLKPGSYVFIGERKEDKVQINLLDYDEKNHEFCTIESIEEAFPYKNRKSVSWINIYGLHDTSILEKIEKQFDIHPLVLEDVLNTGQRPKIEVYDDYLFIVLKMISFDEETSELKIEQISLIMRENFVICFQERLGDIFNPLRKRIKEGKGRARKNGVDYLLYAMMDVIVDNYFLVLEKLGDQIETLDEEVLENASSDIVRRINELKRNFLFLRKNIWPLREVLSSITRDEVPNFRQETMPFLRDLYDHIIQIADTIETYRDLTGGIMDMYMTQMSNRMNEVMKVLTIIATIFIPLTFIAGIYGMNFDVMPELHQDWGYPLVLFIMAIVAFGMVIFFRRKQWL